MQEISAYLRHIDSYIKENNNFIAEKYVQLGSRFIRLLCYSKDFVPLIQKQLSYTLKDKVKKYDATIVLWQEKEVELFLEKFIDSQVKIEAELKQRVLKKEKIGFEIGVDVNPKRSVIIRINVDGGIFNHLEILDEAYSKVEPFVRIGVDSGIINAYCRETNTYYYGVKNLNPEEFIKQGHIFVQIFNKILKTPNSHLVHGAVVGLDNKGVLFCARGQRGKSTLAVLAMMSGFDYVSDDYLVLGKEGDQLYSYPIYSIITLSPRMYNELYDDLKGKFVSNNARRDKYVIDVKAYHDVFREKYPIKVCMFPQIVDDEKPSIVPCNKGQAIVQLVHSTINQLEDKHDVKAIQKLMSFIKDFDFYQINLCSDIKANVECLRQFCSKL